MKFKQKMAQLALTLALPLVATAGDSGAVYGQVSTNGLGIGYAASVKDDWAMRGQFNSFKMAFSGDVGDFGANSKLTADVNLQSIQLLADWYPTASGFRLSGGLVVNNNKVTLTGLGYATRPKDAKGLGFNVDLGVLFQSPKASLTATGVGITQTDIDTQLKTMQDAADKLKLFPVLGLGVSYAF
jgi:hypothetical protein